MAIDGIGRTGGSASLLDVENALAAELTEPTQPAASTSSVAGTQAAGAGTGSMAVETDRVAATDFDAVRAGALDLEVFLDQQVRETLNGLQALLSERHTQVAATQLGTLLRDDPVLQQMTLELFGRSLGHEP